MKRIIITGGSGFIGSNLTDKLLKENKVFIIDNYKTGKKENLKDHVNLLRCRSSINEKDIVDKMFKSFRPDVVVHAAASYKDPEEWEEDVETNILGGINIIRASQRYKVKKFIYFQTALCYGLKPKEYPITLNHPVISGGSSYAISKTSFEQYLELSELNFVSFRLANIYGRRNLTGAIPTFYNRINESKKCVIIDARRDFVFIDDMLQVVIKAIHGTGKRKYYHISSGKDYSILGIFDTMKRLLDKETETEVRQPDKNDTKTLLLDPTDTINDFQWNISTLMEEGLVEAINWYKEHSFGETYTHLKI